ncbi:YveK family protein [Corynebacterium hindlerae]|uniref:YveK family protein n=1 Tax=Corynebacterium hindlerae TaxID=699041 RepID=UPI003AABBBC3
MTAKHVTEDGAISIAQLGYIVRNRRLWILLGVVLGIVIAMAYLVTTPKQYRSTAVVNIVPISSQPVAEGKAASSLIDLATEKQLAESARTAKVAADALDWRWTPERLKSGVKASGDPNGTVINISYSDSSREDAVAGANELAHAYLLVRTNLATERGKDLETSLDQEIGRLEGELREGQNNVSGSQVDDVRAQTIRSAIETLQDRKLTIAGFAPRSGEVITPAHLGSAQETPEKTKIAALGILAGLFVGVLLAFAVHLLSRKPSDDEDLEFLLGVPVWQAERDVSSSTRWDLAAEFVRHASHESQATAVLVDTNAPDAVDAGRAMSSASGGALIEVNKTRGALLRSLNTADAAILVVALTWAKKELLQLKDDLENIGINLLGVVLVDDGLPTSEETSSYDKEDTNTAATRSVDSDASVQPTPI